MKIITIAIPFYNAEKYLAQAIDSVVWQTYHNWQLLLIDDGSTDDSLRIAQEYSLADNRIKVFSDGHNKNLGYRLNQIPNLVDTLYLARMDADDIMHPKRIEKQLEILEANPEIDVLGTNAYTINEKDEVVGMRFFYDKSVVLIKVSTFIHPTIMAKTEWFRNNPYDIEAVRIEDTELWYRTINTSNFMMMVEPLFFYREFGSNYYKKYFKSNDAKLYILNKYNHNDYWVKFFKSNKLKGIIYYIFNLVGKEGILIQRRNKIKLHNKITIKDCIYNGKN